MAPNQQFIQDFETRKKVSFLLDKHKLDRFNYIHSSAVISSDNIGTGIFIYPNCCIYQNSKINSDVIIHANSAIAHNSTVGQGTFISGGVIIVDGNSGITFPDSSTQTTAAVVGEAPNDGNAYVRKNGAWVDITTL